MQEPITTPTSRQPATIVTTSRRQVVSQLTLGEVLKHRREIRRAEKAIKGLKDALDPAGTLR